MLVEFSVENYRSIRDRRTLSLAADPRDKRLPGNTIACDLPSLDQNRLLKSAVVYGANASGKSNLVRAADFMRSFVVNSAARLKPDEKVAIEPFRLDNYSALQPSRFEIGFVQDGHYHRYGFVLDRNGVRHEWLYAYPKGAAHLCFERIGDAETARYEWTLSPRHFPEEWKSLTDKTRPNSAFLSVGAQWNHKPLRRIYDWFTLNLIPLDFSVLKPSGLLSYTAETVQRIPAIREAVSQLLQQADLGISDIVLTDPDPLELLKETINGGRNHRVTGGGGKTFHWLHRVAGGEAMATFGQEEESTGTLKFFALIGPLLACLMEGAALLIDEIGANLHPLLLRNLFVLLHNPEVNKLGAQVIMTTHDTSFMDKGIFRRDQIWFAEKDKTGATDLYSLRQFKPRRGEALQEGYLAGRYGAIPFIRREFRF